MNGQKKSTAGSHAAVADIQIQRREWRRKGWPGKYTRRRMNWLEVMKVINYRRKKHGRTIVTGNGGTCRNG